MSITYTPSTNFGAKDSLPTNDSNKVIRGSEFTTEFTAIQTAFSNAAPSASPTFTGTVTIASVDINGGTLDGVTIGGSSAGAGSFTTLTTSSTVTHNGGTANGVAYLNGSKVLTTGSALTFDGTDFATTGGVLLNNSQYYYGKNAAGSAVRLMGINSGNVNYIGAIDSGPTDAIYGAASTFTNQAWYVGGSEQMRLTSTGLGIGTSSPAHSLSLEQNNKLGWVSTVGSDKAAIEFSGSDDSLRFYNNTGSTERMRIDSSGRLLVGTSTPVGTEQVLIASSSAGSQPQQLNLKDTNASANGNYFLVARKSDDTYVGGLRRSGTDTAMAVDGTAHLAFHISGTEVSRFDGSGNLLVGTTSATFASSGRKCFEVNGATNSIISLADAASGSTVSKFYIHNDQPNGVITYLSESGIDQRWYTGGGERMRLTNGGNFLVGTANALNSSHTIQKNGASTNALVVNNSSASIPYGIQVRYSLTDPNNTSSDYFGAYGGGTTPRFLVRSNGGIANYQANDVNLSDERVKTDIAPLGSMWDKFKALEIVTFKYKDQTHDDTNIGVIAQQVEAVAPEFVDNDGFGKTPEGEEPLKTIYTADLYHAAIKALQEAMARIETLEAEVAALKGA